MHQRPIRETMIHNIGGQYMLRARLADGSLKGHRTGIAVTAASVELEPRAVAAALKQSELQFIQDLILNPPDTRCKYQTMAEAVAAYLEWHEQRRQGTGLVRRLFQPFLASFGDQRPRAVNRGAARVFMDDLSARCKSWNDFRLKVTAPQGMITWLQERDQWPDTNPFSRQLKNYKGRFPARLPTRKSISDAEYEALLQHADPQTQLFVEISRCTGLRASEVMALDIKQLNRVDRVWTMLVSKTSGQQYYRRVAVPHRLCDILADVKILDWSNERKAWEATREAAQCQHVTRKMFRGDWATRMRAAGASHSHIVFQQGRTGDVTDEHYFDEETTLREVRMFIDRMFGVDARKQVSVISS